MLDDYDDPTLIAAAYWHGAWPEPLRLLVESQAALDPQIAQMRAQADRVGGALMECVEPADLGEGALAAALDAIEAIEANTAIAAHPVAAQSANTEIQELLALPDPIRTSSLLALEKGDWQFAGRRVRRLEVAREGEVKAELIRIEPGRGVPVHTHKGLEYTLVLTGAFHDGERRYRCGEVCAAGPDVEHKPIAEADEVCYALAVTNAPLAFKGALGLVQRLFGAG